MNICYYHNDLDGLVSAAILYAVVPDTFFVRVEYGYEIDRIITKADTVYILDFSFPLMVMKHLKKVAAQVVWIDHHLTAIEALEKLSLPGIRSTTDGSACRLTWQFFYPNRRCPPVVEFVSDCDTWTSALGDKSRYFCEHLSERSDNPTSDALQKFLFDENISYDSFIAEGCTLYRARITRLKDLVNRYAFRGRLGTHSAMFINHPGCGDLGQLLYELPNVEIAVCYVDEKVGDELWTKYSLYSPTIDVSEIAKRLGGGGHRSAAGFSKKSSRYWIW